MYADVPDTAVREFVSRQRAGRLVTTGAGGQPHIGLYPFLFLGDRVELHLNRADEQLADLRENPACAFEVDEIYGTIPSHWVDEANAVFATAYHRTVIFEGKATVSDDAAVLAAQMERLLAHYQPEGRHAPVSADAPLYRTPLGMLSAVVIQPSARKVKWKLGQNRDRATRERIIGLFRQRGGPGDSAAADALEWTLAHEDSR